MLTYCADKACAQQSWLAAYEGDYCPKCGGELTPCIECLCGESEYNPKLPKLMPAFCRKCGAKWTEDYLGQCMSQQLKGMVSKIAEKQATLSLMFTPR